MGGGIIEASHEAFKRLTAAPKGAAVFLCSESTRAWRRVNSNSNCRSIRCTVAALLYNGLSFESLKPRMKPNLLSRQRIAWIFAGMVPIHGIRAKDQEWFWVWLSFRRRFGRERRSDALSILSRAAIKLKVHRSHRPSWLRARTVVAFVLAAIALAQFQQVALVLCNAIDAGAGTEIQFCEGNTAASPAL